MRKIDLTPYEFKGTGPDGKEAIIPAFNVKGSIVNALYHPELRLGARVLLDNDRLAQKIDKCDGSVLLEESEYEQVKSAFEKITGFERIDVELVRRVLEAPEVSVKEA